MARKAQRFISVFLVVLTLTALAAAPVFSEGKLSVAVRYRQKNYNLSLSAYGLSEDRKSFSVTVKGFDPVEDGGAPMFGDMVSFLPYNVAIAWGKDNYRTPSSYEVRVSNSGVKISFIFKNKSGIEMSKPRYVIIAEKGTEIKYGWYYDLSWKLFFSRSDIPAEEPTPSPTPRPTPTPTPEPTELPPGVTPEPEAFWSEMMKYKTKISSNLGIGFETIDSKKGRATITTSLLKAYVNKHPGSESTPFVSGVKNRTSYVGRNAYMVIAMIPSESGDKALFLMYHLNSKSGFCWVQDVRSEDEAAGLMKYVSKNAFFENDPADFASFKP